MSTGRLLTMRQAGESTGLGERFIRRLVQERRIASYKLGGKVRVGAADLDEYIAGVASRGCVRIPPPSSVGNVLLTGLDTIVFTAPQIEWGQWPYPCPRTGTGNSCFPAGRG